MNLHTIPKEKPMGVRIPKRIRNGLSAFLNSFQIATKIVIHDDNSFDIEYLWDEYGEEEPHWKVWDEQHYRNWPEVYQERLNIGFTIQDVTLRELIIEPQGKTIIFED